MNGQERAIKSYKGPCVVLAGAGTGKTYTIVEKIKYLISSKIYQPERIVCITFSNEAANNLFERVQRAVDLNGRMPVIKTFHAFSAELLRKYGDKIGINKEFNVLTPDDAKVVMHTYLKVPPGNCHRYISSIGTAKDLGIGLEDLRRYLDRKMKNYDGVDIDKRAESLQFELKTLYLRKEESKNKIISNEIKRLNDLINLKKFVCAWNAYEKLKKIKNYQDYSDLNTEALRLLKENKNVSKDFDYIIVDEFQDTNKIQLDLLYYLAPHNNVTVVGDLNQSIYRFRGAYKKNFNEFKERFNVSNSDVYNLDKSFRSSNKILRAAHKLILNNYSNSDECFKVLNHNNRDGEKIEVYELKNGREETRKVIDLIKREMENGTEMREICVMFRTHQQGRIIKKALEFSNIPFVSVSKNSLLKEKSIKTIIDYLNIINKLKKKERGGEQAWWDLIYMLNFVEQDLIKIGRFIKDNRESDNLSVLMLNSISDLDLSNDGKMASKILIERIKIMQESLNPDTPELIKNVCNIAGLINGQKTKEEKVIMLNLNRFYDLAKEHSALHSPDLGSFIYYLDIIDSLGIEIEAADSEHDGVRLMTSHATKGLEFKKVIITNMSQKRFPIETFKSNPLIPLELSPEIKLDGYNEADLEYEIYEHEKQNQIYEERRLCYVSFTRAKEKLILTYSDYYGNRKFYPSQFLHEVQYKENADFIFSVDNEEKYIEPEVEIKPAINIVNVLKNRDFDDVIANMARNNIADKKQKEITFSPSALLNFIECQKKYEYRYVYNMPEQKTISWEAMLLGSFTHKVLEEGVKGGYKKLKEFEDFARSLNMDLDWEGVDIEQALHLVRVFFERNKNKIGEKSKTEQSLRIKLGGMNFCGFADRIDFHDDGLEIIDYKTGNSQVPVISRNWQLGYYALAASQFGRVKKVTLDMLKHERPLEFEIDEKGEAKAVNSSRMEGFNIYSVEEELIKTAHAVLDAYEKGFKPCPVEKNCEFCSEWVYRM